MPYREILKKFILKAFRKVGILALLYNWAEIPLNGYHFQNEL